MNRKKIFFQGIKDVLPLNIPVVLFGIFYAVLCIELGFSSYFAIGTSLIIFAGGSQLIFITLLTAGAVPWVIFGSVIMNNSRNILYGAVFSKYIEKKIYSPKHPPSDRFLSTLHLSLSLSLYSPESPHRPNYY